MTTADTSPPPPRILGPDDGDVGGPPDGTHDRFLLDGHETEGRVALVEHFLLPKALAAPLHFHTREDEYSFVLEGLVGARLGDHDVEAGVGHLIFKPRGQWHTFWNAGDTPARILEVITPGGLEQAFRAMGQPDFDEETLGGLAGQYGCDVDFENTMPIVERHGLRF